MGPRQVRRPVKHPAGRASVGRLAGTTAEMLGADLAIVSAAAAFVAAPTHCAVPNARRVDAGQIAAVLGAQRCVGNRATAKLLHGGARPAAARRHAPVVQRTPITVDSARVKGFLDDHPVYEKILAGLANLGTVDDAVLVANLLNRFVHRTDFNYTGASVGSVDATSGDCSTLVRQFVAVANECFGLKMTVSDRLPGPLFINGGGQIIHNGAKTGNVDNGTHWRFDDHVWAVWNGTPIDVLFGIVGGLKSSVKVAENVDGVFVADSTTYFPTRIEKSSETNRYTSVAGDRLPAREIKVAEPKAEKPALSREEKLAKAARDLDDFYDGIVDDDVKEQTVDRVMEEVKRRDDVWIDDFLDPKFKTGTLKLFCQGQSMMDIEFDRKKWEAWYGHKG